MPLRTTLSRFLRWLFKLRGSPQAIALGAAVGVFVAFTPTIGFQMAIAAVLATLLGANRPAAVALVWITNPVTLPPVFAGTYWLGSRFWSGPPAATVYNAMVQTVRNMATLDFWAMYDQAVVFVALGRDVLIPLTIGGVLSGVVFAALTYVILVNTIQRYRRRRAARRATRRRRRWSRSARHHADSPPDTM